MPSDSATDSQILTHELRVPLGSEEVSALLDMPRTIRAAFVFAHGAGAGMRHPFMAAVARRLAGHGIATLRFQFPWMENRRDHVDRPEVAHAAVRAAVDTAARRLPGVPLFAGGKSFGGRMTSQAQAAKPLPGVRGLVFVGFPLHPPRKPSIERAEHLVGVQLPMLFVQGTRDPLAELSLVQVALGPIGNRTSLHIADGADHGFQLLVRSGRSPDALLDEICESMASWMAENAS
ncbi:alpha/beta family hydrolase [Ramlibacter sp.]|uniref:alpha/beta hydrolase family protein n=1 Tax=Ramlibacter sp. TaxID=1917967 RepID=UPI003D0A497C